MTIGRARPSSRALLAAALCACSHTLPSPLALPPSTATAEVRPLTTRAEVLAAVLDGDPLARRSGGVSAASVADVDGAQAIAATLEALTRLESDHVDLTTALPLLERDRPGTEAAALLRGYRLALAERAIATALTSGTPMPYEVASLLAPLVPEERPTAIGRHPLAWLATDAAALPDALYRYGERGVLQAWLDGPDMPLETVAELLGGPAYDALAGGPIGRLLLARAAGRRADPSAALADLDRATHLALTHAAADRDAEQVAWAELRRAAAADLGADDPVSALLQRAAAGLIADAGSARSAGAALLAIAADRLDGLCQDDPCAGLDRSAMLVRAGAWDAQVDRRARVWRLIALKDALDGMEAGHDTVRFNRALVDLVDALLGTGAAPPPASLLSRRTEDEAAWSQVGAMLGDASPKTWAEARLLVAQQLHREGMSSLEISDEPSRPLIERITRRAQP